MRRKSYHDFASHEVKLIEVPEKEVPCDDSELSRLCRLVFVPDPKSKMPVSSLSVVFNENVDPQIRDWVQRVLLNGGVPSGVSLGDYDRTKISDDDILELTKARDESNASYFGRVSAFIDMLNKKAD